MGKKKKRGAKHYKATDLLLTEEYLRKRTEALAAKGFPKSRWIGFCETMLKAGFTIRLYEARETFSKYVNVQRGGKRFKVRFSNHRPIRHREAAGDCDFFVGVCNFQVTTTEDAITATLSFFGETNVERNAGLPDA